MTQQLLVKSNAVNVLTVVCGTKRNLGFNLAIGDGREHGDTVHDVNTRIGTTVKSKDTFSMSTIAG